MDSVWFLNSERLLRTFWMYLKVIIFTVRCYSPRCSVPQSLIKNVKLVINIDDPVLVDGDRLASLAVASRAGLINGQVRWHAAQHSWGTN